jgi:hypothetical protein
MKAREFVIEKLNSVVYELGVNLLVRFSEREDMESLLVEVSPAFVLDLEEVNEILGHIILDFEGRFDLNLAFVSPKDGFNFNGVEYTKVSGHIQWREEVRSDKLGAALFSAPVKHCELLWDNFTLNSEIQKGAGLTPIAGDNEVMTGEDHFALAA